MDPEGVKIRAVQGLEAVDFFIQLNVWMDWAFQVCADCNATFPVLLHHELDRLFQISQSDDNYEVGAGWLDCMSLICCRLPAQLALDTT
eukprot:scaffold11356_cov20-Tisochrysis_lutea.AAC.1